MNKFENLYWSSRMAARVGVIGASRKLEKIRGCEPTAIHYSALYSHYARSLGIRPGSREELDAKKITSAITKFWYDSDTILDNDMGDQGSDGTNRAASQKLTERLEIDQSVPFDIRQEAEEMELSARRIAHDSHFAFMASFDPARSTFEDVMGYRTATTGLMAQTIIEAIRIASRGEKGIDFIQRTAVAESLCLQMCDDLIDSVADFRKGLPNLFNALLIENTSERDRFQSACASRAVLETRRPYDIAQTYAPGTLLSYMRRLRSMSSSLPAERNDLVKEVLALSTHINSTPNGLEKLNASDLGKMLARRTRVD